MTNQVMISGLGGKLANVVAEHVEESGDFELMSAAFTGTEGDYHTLNNGRNIKKLGPVNYEMLRCLEYTRGKLLIVDATRPDVVNRNVEVYCELNMPSLVLTTGGDRDDLVSKVESSSTVSLLAPNTARPIVALMSLVDRFSREYQGEWVQDEESGLYIRESHQGVDVPNGFKGKADTSGTAKEMVKSFRRLGIEYDEKDIAKIRDIEDQLALGVPREHLQGHGWHRYKLYSFEKNVDLAGELHSGILGFMRHHSVFGSYDYGPCNPFLRGRKIMSGEQDSGFAVASPDRSVLFRIEGREGELKIDHNVNGREIYADGALDNLRYLRGKVEAGESGKAYSVVDTLN